MNATAPPGNANAPLAKGRREKLTRLVEDTPSHSKAQACAHPATRTERLGDDHVHFAAAAFALTHSSLQNNFPHLRGQTAFRKKRHSERPQQIRRTAQNTKETKT